MIFKLPDRRLATIDRDLLEDADQDALARLARFVEKNHPEDSHFKLDPNWDKETLARKLFWEINPVPPPRMY